MYTFIDDIVDALQKVPHITHAIVTDHLHFHKEKILQSLDAVPMATFEHHLHLLHQLIKKTADLQERLDHLEKKNNTETAT